MDSAEGLDSSQSSSIELSICLTEHDKLAVSTALASSEASHTLEKIGKCVGLTDEEILKIEKDASRVSYLDKVNSIVSQWSLKSGEAATMPNLRNILTGLNDENLQMEIQKAMEAGSVVPESIQDSTCDKGIMVASYVSPNPDLSYHEEPEAPQMRREMQNLETAFATLQRKVYRTLSELNVSNEEYAIFFTSLMEGVREEIPSGSGTVANSYSGKPLATIIQGLTTSKVWYFLSFQVLVEAVEEFGDPTLKDEVKRYQENVAVFREETKFVDFLRVWCSRNRAESLPDCEAVVAKLDSKWSKFTLQDVADTEGYLAGEFRLRSLVFRLTNGGAGSVTIMWLVISSAVELIKQRLEQIPNLALGNVQGLWIGRKLMFQAEPYRSLYHGKVQPSDPQKFWSDLARLFLDWIEPFSKAFEKDENGIMRWFIDGKVNASALCIDRHMAKDPKKVALLWEKDDSTHEEVTYQELHDMTCKLANVLKHHKVEKGDRVVIYMPAMPLAVAAMLGCARIGAVHCVVFSSSDANSLNHRIKETNARVVITANRAMRGKKTHDLKDILDEALSMEGGTQVRLVLVAGRTPKTPVFMKAGRDFSLEKAMEKQPPVCEVTMMDSEDELFIMYTSGTSSAAKGIVHTHAGYLLYVAATHKYVFDYRPGDIFACVAELGWITGHSYVVYGPLCNGATSVLFEGTPLYPDSVHYWKMVERLNVTQLYTVPALLKHLKDEGDQHLKDYKRTSLRTLGSVGEPLNDDVRKWAFEVVGENRCTFINTWWQTEIGGIAITVEYTPTDDPGKPAVEMKPFFGVEPVVLDPQPPHGQKFEGTGNLYLAKALPGMGRRVLNGSNEFANIGKGSEGYFTEDMVKYESKPGNGFRVIGRVDDAVRYQGEYLVLPDVEKQLESADVRIHKAVVVEMRPQRGATNTTERDKCVYVGCKSGTSKAEKSEVKEKLRKDLEERALAFQYIQNIERMPTTPSGKVCRHSLRDRVFLQHDREVSSKEVDEYSHRQRMPICAR